jgi:hypothetical protein
MKINQRLANLEERTRRGRGLLVVWQSLTNPELFCEYRPGSPQVEEVYTEADLARLEPEYQTIVKVIYKAGPPAERENKKCLRTNR